jgi:hypothetical protein
MDGSDQWCFMSHNDVPAAGSASTKTALCGRNLSRDRVVMGGLEAPLAVGKG